MEQGQATLSVETTEADADERGGFGSLGSIIFLLALTWAAGIASLPLDDNSFFTHLATGRLILEEGSVPTTDPYTFTAAGEPWTVQSWLVSVVYAGAEQVAAAAGIKLIVLLTMLAGAVLLWLLSRPAESIILRMTVLSAALIAAGSAWTERPFMVGVIGLGIVWLALEGRVRPAWLVPLLWIWVNSHGSYPFAIVLCLLVLAGEVGDQRVASAKRVDVTIELRVLGAVIVGTLLGAVGPLGLRALLFPLTALTRSEVLGQVNEWQPPQYDSLASYAFLALLGLAVLALVRSGRWRSALPALFFIVVSVVAQRNIALALMVLTPVAAQGMPTFGALRSKTRPVFGSPLATVLTVMVLLVSSLTVWSAEPVLDRYPQRPLAWLQLHPAYTPRLAAQERTGNLLEALDGTDAEVFFDDRFDMFPKQQFDDYFTLSRARPNWERVLDHYDIDAVVWERSQPIASLVATSPRWRVVFSDTAWLLACRRDGESCPRG